MQSKIWKRDNNYKNMSALILSYGIESWAFCLVVIETSAMNVSKSPSSKSSIATATLLNVHHGLVNLSPNTSMLFLLYIAPRFLNYLDKPYVYSRNPKLHPSLSCI